MPPGTSGCAYIVLPAEPEFLTQKQMPLGISGRVAWLDTEHSANVAEAVGVYVLRIIQVVYQSERFRRDLQ